MKIHPYKKRRRLRWLFLVLPLCGLWFMGQGTYIHTKAILAQFLLETAWTKTLHGRQEVKPWPWADTWPVSRLSVPRLGIHRIVLAGASGSTLAFGPGHLFESAAPGASGNTVIAGHRDTHFRFLKELHTGDLITLQSNNGSTFVYKIIATQVSNHTDTSLLDQDNGPLLTLITCYPFDAIQPGGPLRYAVIAKRMGRYRQTDQSHAHLVRKQ